MNVWTLDTTKDILIKYNINLQTLSVWNDRIEKDKSRM